MTNILIFGAGRSATALIKYVLREAERHDWRVVVADFDLELARRKVNGHSHAKAVRLDVTKAKERRRLIEQADLVVSLLPAHLHILVAYDCLEFKKHLITASYVSNEMYRLSAEAVNKELIFLGEMGLDPGIDHMSARKTIASIQARGGKITAFRSSTGGLIAPESDDNPWHYKFTWNPRNVVLAGKGTAQYLYEGSLRYIPYYRLFKEHRSVSIPGLGVLEEYPNRDSLLYREAYGLEGIPTLIRGTLRYPGFCDAWHALVTIGLTDASFPIVDSDKLTYRQWLQAYVGRHSSGTLEERMAALVGWPLDSEVMDRLRWLGLFSDERIRLAHGTPADLLEDLLLSKWCLKPEDKDLVVMHHEFEYELDGKKHRLTSTLKMKGENAHDTAMSRLVGLPLGIFAKLVMQGKIHAAGVNIPVIPEIYNPLLEELKEYGVHFEEYDSVIESEKRT